MIRLLRCGSGDKVNASAINEFDRLGWPANFHDHRPTGMRTEANRRLSHTPSSLLESCIVITDRKVRRHAARRFWAIDCAHPPESEESCDASRARLRCG